MIYKLNVKKMCKIPHKGVFLLDLEKSSGIEVT